MQAKRLKKIVGAMAGKRILAIGDLMLDEYVFGETSRISREAPVLILKWRGREIGFGGASNAVANIAAFGGAPVPVGCVGDDFNGEDLLALFNSNGIDVRGIVTQTGSPTVCKTRIQAGGMHTVKQQIVRIDREPTVPPDPTKIIKAASEVLSGGVDGILVSDYGCGVLSGKVIRFINRIAKDNRSIPVAIDSRYQIHKYRNATLAAPNEEEAGVHKGYCADDLKKIEHAGEELRAKMKATALLITRGNQGISIFEQGKQPKHIPVFGSSLAVDTTGAGDTVVTSALLALCAGASFVEAAEIANRAGGIVVMKKGAATVSPEELLETFQCRF
jgi:rfaE bifunctional protein kinase chain/domain